LRQANIETALRGHGFQNVDVGEFFHGIRPVVIPTPAVALRAMARQPWLVDNKFVQHERKGAKLFLRTNFGVLKTTAQAGGAKFQAFYDLAPQASFYPSHLEISPKN
jgi:hypothetical protein